MKKGYKITLAILSLISFTYVCLHFVPVFSRQIKVYDRQPMPDKNPLEANGRF